MVVLGLNESPVVLLEAEGRWHDGDPEDETATCRTCGHESTSEERHEARTENRVDDLTPALETADGDNDADQADLTGW